MKQQTAAELCSASLDAAPTPPLPNFRMRNKALRQQPRPYSCDVVAGASAPRLGTAPPSNNSLLCTSRLYERRTAAPVGRQAAQQHRMSSFADSAAVGQRSPLARSSSQHELQLNAASKLVAREFGSSSSVERAHQQLQPPTVAVPIAASGGGGKQSRASGRSGESILRRLRFVGARTASAITTSSSSAGSSAALDGEAPLCTLCSSAVGSPVETTSAGSTRTLLLSDAATSATAADDAQADERGRRQRAVAYYDCVSLAGAWGLGPTVGSPHDTPRPTGASQAQSTADGDPGDGKCNALLASCQAFRNELGCERTRRLGLGHWSMAPSDQCPQPEAPLETWHREATAAEAGVLENLSNVYFGGRLCAARQPQMVVEPTDPGAYYYRHCFAGRPHQNFFGVDENVGPVAVSLVKDRIDDKEAKAAGLNSNGLFRVIVRISDVGGGRRAGATGGVQLRTLRLSVPEDALGGDGATDLAVGAGGKSHRALLKELLELVYPSLCASSLRLGLPVLKTEELLAKLDEQPIRALLDPKDYAQPASMIYTRYKVGVLYCRAGQSTEEQMYNNETASEGFEEFLELLGQRVKLKAFDGYKGGLDTRGDTTGSHSLYAAFQQHQVMFHVSTLLPYTPSNRQQLARKRHIGNDMVTIIFQDPGALPFSPSTVRSHFQHVFIVVRANNACTDQLTYSVAVSRAKDVPAFGPPLPPGATFPKSSDFREYLLTKIINAENAVHNSIKFASMAARTRREVLKDLAENHVAAHSSDGPSRIASRLLGGGSMKRRERPPPTPLLADCLRGALSWEMDVDDFSSGTPIASIVGLSADSLVMLEQPAGQVIFATPTHSVLGWSTLGTWFGAVACAADERRCSHRVYYDHGAVLSMRTAGEADAAAFVRRLETVTRGCAALELLLRRNPAGQLGFRLQHEGIITDVEMYGAAWHAGLRQGSRIVEICRVSVSTLTLEQMHELLATSEEGAVRVLVIPPAADGSPRRGCEDAYCAAAKADDALAERVAPLGPMLVAPPFPSHPPGRQPPSYAEFSKRLAAAKTSADQGYESGTTWSREETAERRTTADWTLSSVSSSEEHWTKAANPRTDTLSSSGSASSEMSADGTPQPHHSTPRKRLSRPHDMKRKDRSHAGFIACNFDSKRADGADSRYRSEPNMDQVSPSCLSVGGPPLPPRTYRRGQSHATDNLRLCVSSPAQAVRSGCDAEGTRGDVQGGMARTHSEEWLSTSERETSPSHVDGGASARTAAAAASGCDWNSGVVAAAARVLARNPELGSCQLRLQAALQRVKAAEERVDKLANDLARERRARQDAEAEVTTLREDRQRLERERTAAEAELRRFSDWVCTAAPPRPPPADTTNC